MPRHTRPAQAHTAHHRSVTNRVVCTRDGVRIAVCDRGADAEVEHTIVLLHGLCLSSQSWSGPVHLLAAALGHNTRIISYDHRGHGRSGHAPMSTYHLDQLADDLADVLASLRINTPLTLAGHSLGGMVALSYCVRSADLQPVQPSGLVLVATAAGQLAERGMGRLLASPALTLLTAVVDHAPLTAVDHAVRLLGRPAGELLARYGRCGPTEREALCSMCAAALTSTALSTPAGFLPRLRGYDKTAVLARVRPRTTVLSGGADLLTPVAHAQQLVAGIEGATHRHYPHAGHMLIHQVPGEIAAAIAEMAPARPARRAEAVPA